MQKISNKLKKKLASLRVKIPEDLYLFSLDCGYYEKLTDEEMGELFRFFRENNREARTVRALKHGNRQDPDVRRGKIYLADLDPVTGSEQGGIRPVMILQNDHTNQKSRTVIVAAVTKQKKKDHMITHVAFQIPGEPQESCVLLEQIRSIDKNRLVCFISDTPEEIMDKVNDALTYSLDL